MAAPATMTEPLKFEGFRAARSLLAALRRPPSPPGGARGTYRVLGCPLGVRERLQSFCCGIKPWAELPWPIKTYFCFAVLSLLGVLGLTVSSLVQQSNEDSTVSLIQLIGVDDHARIKLRSDNNPSRSDYINASPIIEHDPRIPAYIATQGPQSHTIQDFWQMVWENGCTVIVMLTPLVEDGVKHCDRYWPDEGSSLYHIYEVNLVSEHIWCEDFLVRSFYLKNVQTQETRTLTQFHFLSWPAEGTPSSTRPLLDFRRKVNKSFRGRSCPIIVHCSDGAGRAGTYILIDMVLNRMAKGVKEIDIAASLEHVRDQRPGMVRTKDQFEFALTAVAEEVNAILKALPQ
ncbi:receptor-type tyrosine-protein phosphatase-like N [Mantella aurantiaca]